MKGIKSFAIPIIAAFLVATIIFTTTPINATDGVDKWELSFLTGATALIDKIKELEERITVLEGYHEIPPPEDPPPEEPPPEEPPPTTESPIKGFTILSVLNDTDALQGIASDGEYLYVTGARDGYAIYKYDKDGNLIDSLPNANSFGVFCSQVNGIFIKEGLLYIGSFMPHITTQEVREGFIKVFDADTLEYIEEHYVGNHLTEGAYFYDGYWWVIYHNWNYLARYNEDWDLEEEYFLPYATGDSFGETASNGILWAGDYVYINNHEDGFSNTLDCYLWTGDGLEPVARFSRPTPYCSQGIYKEPDGDVMWWAERHGGGEGIHNIVKSRLDK